MQKTIAANSVSYRTFVCVSLPDNKSFLILLLFLASCKTNFIDIIGLKICVPHELVTCLIFFRYSHTLRCHCHPIRFH